MQIQKSNLNNFRAKVFRALSDPVRLEIIEFLRDGEKCVCEIIPHVDIIQPVVSRHLKILKDCGLVRDRKDGTRRLYSLTDSKIFEIIDALTPEMANGFSRRLIEQIMITT
jgi:ArsR family transcriptional regulator